MMHAMPDNMMLDWMAAQLAGQHALGWNGPYLQTQFAATWVLAIGCVNLCWHACCFTCWLVAVWLLCGWPCCMMHAMLCNLMLDWMAVQLAAQHARGWNGPCLQTHFAATWVLALGYVNVCWHVCWFTCWLVAVWLAMLHDACHAGQLDA
jgi:hypothetical protein